MNQPQVETDNYGKLVAINIETGIFAIVDTGLLVTSQLFEQYPATQPWIIRIGHRAVYHFGSRILDQKP